MLPAHVTRRLSGRRPALLLGLLLVGGVAAAFLRLSLRDLWPGANGRSLVTDFVSAAVAPGFDYESTDLPAGAPPFWHKALGGAHRTLIFAVAALSVSLVAGLILGCLCSTSWWFDDPYPHVSRCAALPRRLRKPAARRAARLLILVLRALHELQRRGLQPIAYGSARLSILLMRSVHELLFAVLFLAAVGLTPFSGVLAIAIPFSGTLAKVFSEMMEEAPRSATKALQQAGASRLQVLLFAILPASLPDMASYSLYRLECAIRSSAVLGFFGYETLGLYVKTSFENYYFGEVWSYLYVLLGVVLLVEWSSASLRRRFVA
jgi:phosphonate transport system permease protein